MTNNILCRARLRSGTCDYPLDGIPTEIGLWSGEETVICPMCHTIWYMDKLKAEQ